MEQAKSTVKLQTVYSNTDPLVTQTYFLLEAARATLLDLFWEMCHMARAFSPARSPEPLLSPTMTVHTSTRMVFWTSSKRRTSRQLSSSQESTSERAQSMTRPLPGRPSLNAWMMKVTRLPVIHGLTKISALSLKNNELTKWSSSRWHSATSSANSPHTCDPRTRHAMAPVRLI